MLLLLLMPIHDVIPLSLFLLHIHYVQKWQMTSINFFPLKMQLNLCWNDLLALKK